MSKPGRSDLGFLTNVSVEDFSSSCRIPHSLSIGEWCETCAGPSIGNQDGFQRVAAAVIPQG
ncbi:MAG: hypothetical protein ACRDT5_13490, partial [Mycobacterium sp.]